jgi:hypothetical protein
MRYRKPEKVDLGDTPPVAAVDARSLVPVSDEIGGVVIYVGGRPAYYVLNGEWFAAVQEPVRVGDATLLPNEILSTS